MPEGLQRDIRANAKFTMVRQGYSSIAEYGDGNPLAMRPMAVAGGGRMILRGREDWGRFLRGGCEESRAFVVDGALHAWNLQWPELFARGINAWAEKKALPGEFKKLR